MPGPYIYGPGRFYFLADGYLGFTILQCRR